MKAKISAIILAGGKASRLGGVDKGLVEWRGKPLIEHVVVKLQMHIEDIIISANRNIATYQTYAKKVVSDETDAFLGPLVGIKQCLPQCLYPKVLVTTCDMPLMPKNLPEYFDLKSQCEIQVLEIKGRRQLCWLMEAHLLNSLEFYLQQGGQRVMQWVDSCNTCDVHIPETDYAMFKNFNSPSEFK